MVIENQINVLPWHKYRRWGYRPTHLINKIVLHQALCDATTKNINAYHIKPNHISSEGLPHFAYHYSIEKDGKVIQANELTHILAHTKSQNMSGIGIMLCGNFEGINWWSQNAASPTPEQITSLYFLLDKLIKDFNFNTGNLYTHAQFGKLACPGLDIERALNAYRKKLS